jgi:hypothetical protein
MGAHFSCPFAIITTHCIETIALKKIRETYDVPIYFRYIDDIILGPVKFSNEIHQNILRCFNSVNENIQFTIEIPPTDNFLCFLDLEIRFNNCTCFDYKWYSKSVHSGICFSNFSNHPFYMKKNFVINCYKTVKNHCSSIDYFNECWPKMIIRLTQNGYNHNIIQRIISNQFKPSSKQTFPNKLKVNQLI